MKKIKKGYWFVSFWALFVSLINAGRKYYYFKGHHSDESMTLTEFMKHFTVSFIIYLLLGWLLVFVLYKLGVWKLDGTEQ